VSYDPIQSKIAGPAPNSSYTLQFDSNVVAGDLLIVQIWSGSVDQYLYTTLGDTSVTVPTGCTQVIFEVWGAGGTGGPGDGVSNGGDGGGGGGYGKGTFSVTPGDALTVTIGDTDQDSLIAKGATHKVTVPSGTDGGTGGSPGTGSSPTFGAGASSTISTTGGVGVSAAGATGGDGGNGANGGTGGAGAGIGSGANGAAPGGGGGGSAATGGVGGNGARGQARITWIRSVSISDNQGNSYVADVSATRKASSSSHAVHAWIYSAVVGTGGNRPILTVDFGNVASGILLAGAGFLEYPTVGSPPVDTTSSATDDGTVGHSTANLTTGHNNELVIALGVGEGDAFSGSGWTQRNLWSGTFSAEGEDQTVASAGGTVSATESSATVSCIILAAYRMVAANVYNDSLTFGVAAGTAQQVAVGFSGALTFGVAGGTAEVDFATFRDVLSLGALLATSDALATAFGVPITLGISSGTTDSGTASIRDGIGLGVQAGLSYSLLTAFSGPVGIGILAASVTTAQAVLRGAIALGSQEATTAASQAIVQAGAPLGIAAGTSANAQAVIAGAIAAGILQGIAANPGGATVYSDVIGLGVAASAQAGVAVGGFVSATLGLLAGIGNSVRLDVRDVLVLGSAEGFQSAAFLQAAAQIGIGLGAHIGAGPLVTFRDHVSLAIFAATLARYITPATIRLLTVPVLQRSFTVAARSNVIPVPVCQRSFMVQEEVMLYLLKHPLSTEDFDIDLTGLAGITTINSISVPAVAGITLADQGLALPMARIRIGGGASGQAYLISVLANLDSGEVKVVNLTLTVALVPGIVNATQVPVEKDPRSNENFQLLWTPMLGTDTVASSSWQASPPVPVTNPTNDTQSASAWLGASANGRYPLTNTIMTGRGQVKACDLYLLVNPQ